MNSFYRCAAFFLLWSGFAAGLWAQTNTDLQVVQSQSREENGFYTIVGEIKNTGKVNMAGILIYITLLDENKNPIGVDRFTAQKAGVMKNDGAVASHPVIAAGDTGVFVRTRDMNKIKGKVASYTLSLVGSKAKPVGIATVERLVITPQTNQRLITGLYKNTGTAACKNPKVVAAGYTKDGKICEVTDISLTKDGRPLGEFIASLGAGESAPFKLRLTSPKSAAIETVKVWACCDEN
jgi:hypothetical protein